VNIDDLIATAQPRIEKVRICARGDLVAKHQEAVVAMSDTISDDDSLSGNPATIAAAEAVKAIEDEMDAATVEFTIRSTSRQKWADLLAKHPPSKEERRAGHDHDPKRFPVAAVAECTQAPEMTVQQAAQLADVLPAGEWNKLWLAVLGLNVTGTPAPKLAAATDLLQANGRSSTTPPLEVFPEAGSLAGSGKP
jgi:hypothetical protein